MPTNISPRIPTIWPICPNHIQVSTNPAGGGGEGGEEWFLVVRLICQRENMVVPTNYCITIRNTFNPPLSTFSPIQGGGQAGNGRHRRHSVQLMAFVSSLYSKHKLEYCGCINPDCLHTSSSAEKTELHCKVYTVYTKPRTSFSISIEKQFLKIFK